MSSIKPCEREIYQVSRDMEELYWKEKKGNRMIEKQFFNFPLSF